MANNGPILARVVAKNPSAHAAKKAAYKASKGSEVTESEDDAPVKRKGGRPRKDDAAE